MLLLHNVNIKCFFSVQFPNLPELLLTTTPATTVLIKVTIMTKMTFGEKRDDIMTQMLC